MTHWPPGAPPSEGVPPLEEPEDEVDPLLLVEPLLEPLEDVEPLLLVEPPLEPLEDVEPLEVPEEPVEPLEPPDEVEPLVLLDPLEPPEELDPLDACPPSGDEEPPEPAPHWRAKTARTGAHKGRKRECMGGPLASTVPPTGCAGIQAEEAIGGGRDATPGALVVVRRPRGRPREAFASARRRPWIAMLEIRRSPGSRTVR
jgi:hypothetical protein